MNCNLTRTLFDPTGIISNLTDDKSNLLSVTLDHAYPDSNGLYVPKIPDGVYTCKRGTHMLPWRAGLPLSATLENLGAKLVEIQGKTYVQFETFEITNVPGYSNCLFHWGNKNDDSEGCVLTGEQMVRKADESCFVTNSQFTFGKFMAMQSDVDQFQLTVSSPASS